MKILFIENRYRTRFWRVIGSELEKKGHIVKFLVQNHIFADRKSRKVGKDYVIPYPGSDNHDTKDERNFELIKSDRNINYFQHKHTGHYDYYRREIEKFLTEFQPDIVFGESTAFHELIAIDICKKSGILYLHPSTCRYPIGRFSFYLYDTLTPYCGSKEILDKKTACKIITSITERTIKPDYMHKPKFDFHSKVKRLRELMTHTFAYYSGEKYNTPNPFVKRKIERRKNFLIAEWEKVANEKRDLINKKSFKILYPMQMQPEANLDVWGRPYRNQADTIRQILRNSGEDVYVIVKPNPKSKYEMSDELLDLIKENHRIIPIPHSQSMDNVLPAADLVITVTGTIAIECILSDKPILTLIYTLNNMNENCMFVESCLLLRKYIKNVYKGKRYAISEDEKCSFLNTINQTSYQGMPYESYINDIRNLDLCLAAFNSVMSKD